MHTLCFWKKLTPEVSVVVNDFDHEEYKVAIRNFLQADAPDIAIWFAGNRMKFFVDQGLLEDVSDVGKVLDLMILWLHQKVL